MFIKLYYAEKIHKISKIPESFGDFQAKVQAIFGEVKSFLSFVLQYEDEEGDRIMLADDTDYNTMISIESHQKGNNTIKVYVVERKTRGTEAPLTKKSCLRKTSGSRSPKNQKKITFEISTPTPTPTPEETPKETPKETIVEESKSTKLAQQAPTFKAATYQAYVLKDTVSEAGHKLNLIKDTFVTIQRIL